MTVSALAEVETGRWLQRAGVGLRLLEGEALGPLLDKLTPDRYARLSDTTRALPREHIAFSPDDHRSLVRQLETAAS